METELDTMISINDNPGLGEEVQKGTDPNIGGINPTATWNRRFVAAVAPSVGLPAAIEANPNTNPSALSYNLDHNDNTAWAVFAQANYDVAENWEFSFALRYDRD